jgi:hypothetical protein
MFVIAPTWKLRFLVISDTPVLMVTARWDSPFATHGAEHGTNQI